MQTFDDMVRQEQSGQQDGVMVPQELLPVFQRIFKDHEDFAQTLTAIQRSMKASFTAISGDLRVIIKEIESIREELSAKETAGQKIVVPVTKESAHAAGGVGYTSMFKS